MGPASRLLDKLIIFIINYIIHIITCIKILSVIIVSDTYNVAVFQESGDVLKDEARE